MTNRTEKPFEPFYGGNLNDLLFNLSEAYSDFEIEEQITLALNNYEPRARVLNVKSKLTPDRNMIGVSVTFKILTTNQVDTTVLSLTRVR
jgi:phage baseplate assembly protein W